MSVDSKGNNVRSDAIVGLINAVVNVPDGLANGALAGVTPVYGLHATMVGPIMGGLLSSTRLMVISTTSASSLAAGQAISIYPEAQRDQAMFLLVALTGIFLTLFGLLRLGRLMRFVSYSVMTGFLMGVTVVLVLDQAAPLVGFNPQGANEIVQFIDLLTHGAQFSVPTILTGLLTLGILVGLERTRFATLASLVALVVPTLLVALAGWEGVQLVTDVNPLPRGLPTLVLPDPTLLTLDLIGTAFAVAVVIAIQGAGVSQSVENPDGIPISLSRDMVAQGVANVASGLLSGIPVGGSVGQTALNVSAGARSRWAGVLGGIWILVFVLLMPGLVGQVPMAVLAALMIVAGIRAINLDEARSIWNVGGAARWGIFITFLATLALSVPMAVAVGVLLSIVLYLSSSASDASVRQLVPLGGGRFSESEPPARLPSNTVTILDVYGSLFFAGARMLAETLPSPHDATRPVVILRLRGRTRVGATLIEVLDQYADDLADVGGRLYLSGVDARTGRQLLRTRKLDLNENVYLIGAREILGESTEEAWESANEWLGSARTDPPRIKTS